MRNVWDYPQIKTFFFCSHSIQKTALGGFILFFGFLAFNGGSQAAIANEGDANAVALAIVNTVLGGESIVPEVVSYE